jgi:hypothetical protein
LNTIPNTASASIPRASGSLRFREPTDGSINDKYRTRQQYQRVDKRPQQRKPPVSVSKLRIALFFRQPLKIPCQRQRETVAQIVQCIRNDGDTVGKKPANNFDDTEPKVQEKSCFDVIARMVMAVMFVMMPLLIIVFVFLFHRSDGLSTLIMI